MNQASLSKKLTEAIDRGEPFESVDPKKPEVEVSASHLRHFLLTTPRNAPSDQLWLRRARIKDELDLEAVHLDLRLRFEDCTFESDVNLAQAEARNIEFIGCELEGGLSASQIAVLWNFQLDGSRSDRVSLHSASIRGHLSLDGATLDSDATTVLTADGVQVAGGMSLRGFEATGEVRMPGAKVGGQVSMNGAKLHPKEGSFSALTADGIDVTGGMFFRDGFEATGEVRLSGAKVGGQVSMNGANLRAKEGARTALTADGIEISGGTFFREGFEAVGDVRLHGARISNQMSMAGAKVEGTLNLAGALIDAELGLVGAKLGNGEGQALYGDRVRVSGGMFCREGFETDGEIRLLGAKIGGQLSMKGATLRAGNEMTPAFSADGIQIGGGLFCDDGFEATGEVRLPGAKIGGQFLMSGAKLRGHDRRAIALSADGIEVGSSVFCDDEFEATGEVRLSGAKIGGQLTLDGSKLNGPNSLETDAALNLVGCTADELVLCFASVTGAVDLRDCSVRSLWDASQGQLAGDQPGELRLQGFAYESLRVPLDAKQRLNWIAPSQSQRYLPGVYLHLSNAFRRIGHRSDVRRVSVSGERRARQEYRWWDPRGWWSDLLFVTVGYGYRNWLAGLWLLGLLVAGSVIFHFCPPTIAAKTPAPSFNSILYTIDVTVPVLDIGQQTSWIPSKGLAWVSALLAILGYALATAVLAGAARLLNRDEL